MEHRFGDAQKFALGLRLQHIGAGAQIELLAPLLERILASENYS